MPDGICPGCGQPTKVPDPPIVVPEASAMERWMPWLAALLLRIGRGLRKLEQRMPRT